MKQIFWTIFLGNELWENVIDDMNTTEDWSKGGMLWKDKRLAETCIEDLKKYGFETEQKKFRAVKLS